MSLSTDVSIRLLTPDDVASLQALLAMLGEAFEDVDSYTGNPPDAEYLWRSLASDSFVALTASRNGEVVGGLAAYELKKFEQRRTREEVLHFDIAVEVGTVRGRDRR